MVGKEENENMWDIGSFLGVQAAGELGRELLSCTIYRTCNGNNQVQGNKFKKELTFLDATPALVLFLLVGKWK